MNEANEITGDAINEVNAQLAAEQRPCDSCGHPVGPDPFRSWACSRRCWNFIVGAD